MWSGLLSATMCLISSYQIIAFIKKVSKVLDDTSRGDFELRVINKYQGGILKKLADASNRLNDTSDAFVREGQLVMNAVTEKRFQRTIRPEGLQGAFRVSLNAINKAVALMERKTFEEKVEKDAMQLTLSDIENLAHNVQEGKLDNRLSVGKNQQNYSGLINSMNRLIETAS